MSEKLKTNIGNLLAVRSSLLGHLNKKTRTMTDCHWLHFRRASKPWTSQSKVTLDSICKSCKSCDILQIFETAAIMKKSFQQNKVDVYLNFGEEDSK